MYCWLHIRLLWFFAVLLSVCLNAWFSSFCFFVFVCRSLLACVVPRY
jgi:hypothetical protein